MPSFPSQPLVRPRDDGLQLSYQLAHRVHAAKGYPLLAPNGSSVIVYGHEHGLTVVWRGGRRFSEEQPAPKTDKPKGKANGGDDSIMIIDSDEESAHEPAKEEEPSCQFDTEEPEVDPAYPFEGVLRQVDVPLGSRVLDLAVPRVLPETARSPLEPFPPILSKNIVVSAVCADLSTRVVTLPLAPPHPATDATQIQTLLISGGVSHQEIPRGVSITFTCQEADAQGLGRSRRASTSKGPDSRGKERWDLLVATHSAEASGLLLLHQIPIVEESDGLYYVSESDLESRRRSLPSPAKSIAFNPSSYPSARHSTLLVAFHSGCIKIYSCFSQSRASRKPSAEETEIDGKWLISLYPGFEQSGSGMGRRKTVVDAEWVLGGRAVMVLLADGEWGVWDIEGAGPGSMKGPLERQSSIQGVSGGSLTAYSVSGKILRPFADGKSETGAGEQRRFAPMTPSTKRVREDNLLKGSGGTPSTSLCGQISVIQTNSSRDVLPDESVLVRHGKQLAVIPSLLSLWRNATKATGTFDSSSRCRVSTIADINLMGENFTGIGALPAAARRTRQTERTEFDILVTGEHRIVVLAPELSEPAKADFQPANETTSAETDQLMLQKGELDVNGMGRVLNGMARSQRMSPTKRVRTFT